MSRNRYVGDYHLADSLDERGKIRTDVEYVGDRYSFTEGPETVRRAKRKERQLIVHTVVSLAIFAAGWLFLPILTEKILLGVVLVLIAGALYFSNNTGRYVCNGRRRGEPAPREGNEGRGRALRRLRGRADPRRDPRAPDAPEPAVRKGAVTQVIMRMNA